MMETSMSRTATEIRGQAKELISQFTVSESLRNIITDALTSTGYDVETEAIEPHSPWEFIQVKFKVFQTRK